ncbi:hypothetical protein AAHE18_11G138700 [Arachis hypogaea]
MGAGHSAMPGPCSYVFSTHRCGKGRNARGIITTGHRGGGHKRLYRKIDFFRNEKDIYGAIIGDTIISGTEVPIKMGNSLPLSAEEACTVWEGVLIDQKEESTSTDMPLGTAIHNIEITLGKGGQLARAAGAVAKLIAKEGKSATLKLPSGEVRLISKNCSATVGQVGNVGKKPATPWGYPALGRRSRKRNKYSDNLILHRRSK